jgi:hypothetical protein
MNYELRLLTVREESFTVFNYDITTVDKMIEIFGNKMSEITSIVVVAKTPTGDIIIHQQSWS